MHINLRRKDLTNSKMATIIEARSTKHEPTFCTLFSIGNEHLTKDVGLIPYGMYKYQGYNTFVATYENGDYPNQKYVPGLRLEFIPKISGNWLEDSCAWLRENAKRIDVLNLYHLCSRSFRHLLVYKRYNPKGKVYLKCDGAPGLGKRKKWKRFLYVLLKRPFYRWMLRHCKFISTELEENCERMFREWQVNIGWVPNPFNHGELRDFRPFSERSNFILTVGRLGTKQKATEILLEAFAKIADKIPNWKLKLTGPIMENMNIASDFYAKYPELKERVIFTGGIYDRKELIEIYNDAKIFAFLSRWESFGIALTEAMMNGCFAVVSDIFSSRSLTENFKFALSSEVDDIDGLAKNLLYACTHEDEIEKLAIEGREATLKRCDLKRVCKKIADGLK